MKLLFFTSSLKGGGAERVLVNLANELVNRNYDVTVSSNKYMNDYYVDPRVTVKYATKDNVATSGKGILRNINQLRKYFWYFRFTDQVIKEVQPDIIISFQHCNMLAITFFHKSIPIISSEHNAFDRKLGLREYLNRFYLTRLWNKVIALTPFDNGYAKAKGLKNTLIIPNPLSWETISIEEFKNSFDTRSNLIACGRVDAWYVKGYDLLIEAFSLISSKYPQWELNIAGKGSTGSVNKLMQLAEERGVGNKVHFLGFRPDVKDLVMKHSCMVLSSRTEGFPMTVIEAMSVGTPCVCFERLANSIIANNVDGKLVPNQNVEKLAAALASIIEDKDKRYAMGINAITNIKRFSASEITNKWEDLFHSIN